LKLIDTWAHGVCEVRVNRKDGQLLWLRLDLSITKYEDNYEIILVSSDITFQKQIDDIQSFLLGFGWSGSGRNFFEALAEFLATVLCVDYVCIDRLIDGGLAAETVAVYFDGHYEDNVKYALEDTPCGQVAGKNVCYFPNSVRTQTPSGYRVDGNGPEAGFHSGSL
jgi:hypothetical protein